MEPLTEDKTCYETPEQRAVLVDLLAVEMLRDRFFLTGGTALSVFYLHHRLSNDLDFFSCDLESLEQLDYEIRLRFGMRAVLLRGSEYIRTYRIDNTKIDIVRDQLSFKHTRPTIDLEPGRIVSIDTLRNIASNKLTAMASRSEPKDFIDLYIHGRRDVSFDLHAVYADAKLKDAIFDDPASAAYAIEANLEAARKEDVLWPQVKVPCVISDIDAWYARLINDIYAMQPRP